MRRIYEQADRVCIWLGEMTESGQGAIDDLRSPVFRITTTGNASLTLISPSIYQSKMCRASREHLMARMIGLDNELHHGELREPLCRPWWTRMWIMQEAIVAPNLILMCGSETFSWDAIQRSISRRRSRGEF